MQSNSDTLKHTIMNFDTCHEFYMKGCQEMASTGPSFNSCYHWTPQQYERRHAPSTHVKSNVSPICRVKAWQINECPEEYMQNVKRTKFDSNQNGWQSVTRLSILVLQAHNPSISVRRVHSGTDSELQGRWMESHNNMFVFENPQNAQWSKMFKSYRRVLTDQDIH